MTTVLEAEEIADAAARAAEAVPGGGRGGWGRRAGFAGATLGLVAAGVAVERLTVNRGVRRKARLALDAAGPYGSLRGTPGTVRAEDGTELYFETDEPELYEDASDPEAGSGSAGGSRGARTGNRRASDDSAPLAARTAAAAAAGDGVGGPTVDPVRIEAGAGEGDVWPGAPPTPHRSRLMRMLRRRPGPADGPDGRPSRRTPATPPTVVFTHGYCLSQDVWHFQRAALRGAVRTVYWDQRSHGRSGRAPVGEPVTIDQLGRDLKAVLDEAVPEGPIVLVGHSMGGMTVMALADQYPGFVAERVTGVALIDTSAGGLGEVTYGLPLPTLGVKAVRRVVPGVLKAMVAQSALVERGRRATADLFAGLVKRYSFGDAGSVDPGVARFAERLIESVPIDVVAEFYPAFEAHEKTEALAAFDGCSALVLAGERDLLTPYAHSEAIAAALPSARLRILEKTGHLSMLERPHEVNEALAQLITRAVTGG
ncbi:alpha/beta hydrolase [Streptomyces bathyalis]|uniref:Alpha/beta hydrolase n=1 Tax=Streptomyces bathyalis TaxID=2710756 RepID=A0A7T1WSB8_9ACTN|nr:alpha/beta hydrolase [Streptomyces bathyalis]QPP06972.1 alpha/beta hydrolase [Streptomyces bathyalis]